MINNIMGSPTVLAWFLLCFFMLIVDMFAHLYQYSVAFILLACYVLQISYYLKHKHNQQGRFRLAVNTWAHIWRVATGLFISIFLIMGLAMIYYPNDFINYRTLAIMLILGSNFAVNFVLFSMPSIKKIIKANPT